MPKKHSNAKPPKDDPEASLYKPTAAKQWANTGPDSGSGGKELPGAFSLFAPSWEGLKLNFWSFVLGCIIPVLILVVPLLASLFGLYSTPLNASARQGYTIDTAHYNAVLIVFGALGIFASTVFFLPYMYLLKFQSAKGKKVGFRDNFKQCLPYFWRMLGLFICRGLIILAGLILLIVPGLYMWRRYMLAPFYMLDKNTGVFESLKLSAADSKPFAPAIWGMIGVYVLMSAVGIIPFLGWAASLVLSVTYCCAQALRYLQIKKA